MKTEKWIFSVERKEIHYVRYTLESYDGMAVVRTLDPRAGLIEVTIVPGCESEARKLIDALREQEGLAITEARPL
ncbi:MAG: DUF4911 domain-containing protein [Deltaproteobacteria bacterium]|nr:DUF4911 domain-containing protein [Deltaproteobacteria bacterium]MBW1818016.1 DUF4911 domain-containing protein [Deltaproteobacteria bacterium]